MVHCGKDFSIVQVDHGDSTIKLNSGGGYVRPKAKTDEVFGDCVWMSGFLD